MRMQSLLKVAQPWSNRFGHCPICAGRSCFVPTEASDLIRNHAICVRCRSSSRNRHVAKCILDAFADRGIRTLADFREHRNLKVYNTVSVGPIVQRMGQGENIIVSEYFDDVDPGNRKGGVLCQDLERLTFPDSSFDLVISEDVFEHVVDFRKGFAEVYRVLKPGGCHVFSIPFYFDRKTRPLFEMKNGKPLRRSSSIISTSWTESRSNSGGVSDAPAFG